MDELLDATELDALSRDLGQSRAFGHHVQLTMSRPTFDDWWHAITVRRERRGEVLLVLQRPDGQVLLHTKTQYPANAHRLLTGGIHYEEPVLAATARECLEETGLSGRLERYLGYIAYTLTDGERTTPFVSYAMLVAVDDTPPAVQDADEAIAEFVYVPPATLPEIAGRLRRLPADWASWGEFRSFGHDFVAAALEG